jgi:hypothetical protein
MRTPLQGKGLLSCEADSETASTSFHRQSQKTTQHRANIAARPPLRLFVVAVDLYQFSNTFRTKGSIHIATKKSVMNDEEK